MEKKSPTCFFDKTKQLFLLSRGKTIEIFFQIFVAFSEKLNFIEVTFCQDANVSSKNNSFRGNFILSREFENLLRIIPLFTEFLQEQCFECCDLNNV